MKNHTFKLGDLVMPKKGILVSQGVKVHRLITAEIVQIYDMTISIKVKTGVVEYHGEIYSSHFTWYVNAVDFEISQEKETYEIY